MGSVRNINADEIIKESEFIELLKQGGFSDGEAKLVLAEADTIGLSPDDAKHFQRHFVDEGGKVDVSKVDAFMHVHAAKMTLDSYLPVLENRADNEDNQSALHDLYDTIKIKHGAGLSAAQIADDINGMVKISKSYTPHPTEHLTPKGIELSRNLVLAAESAPDERAQKLTQALSDITNSQEFSARSKSNMIHEMDYSNECARIHNAGVNELDREVEGMIYDITGEHVDINTNTAARSWDYDADGKNNADGIAMMAKMATTMLESLKDTSGNIELALQSKMSEDQKDALTGLKTKIDSVIDNITPVYDRSREITEELAALPPEQRQSYYMQAYEADYDKMFDKLEHAFDHLDGKKRGLGFYYETLETLDTARKEMKGVQGLEGAHDAIDDSYRTNRRVGFALEKGQTRHNDLVYIRMLDNMMDSDEFWGLDILHAKDREEIMQAGGFSNIDLQTQYEHWEKILDYADKNGNRKQLVDILDRANPITFKSVTEGGNGYPDQENALVDRMELRSLFPFIFEEGIISDSQAIGSPRQKFIADMMNMVHMKHMSLNEDRVNLGLQGKLTRTFNDFGGSKNMEVRKQKVPEIFRRKHQTLHVMRPASDAERFGGSFTRLQAIDQVRQIVREGYEMKTPVEVMIGGGQSNNRFGGDVDMYRRIAAQELKQILMEKQESGEELDQDDLRMMIMATSTLYTEQGRTKRFSSATPHQVRDDFAGKMANQLKDLTDLQGFVNDFTFIDPKFRFSPEMDALQRTVYEKAIDDYQGFAYTSLKGKNGKATDDLVLDNFADMAGCPNLVDTQNFGARPGAGKAKGSAAKKKTSGKRAIGKDQTLYTMQSFHCGFMASGAAMERFHDALTDKKINVQDFTALTESPEWEEAIFSRNLLDAERFNAAHLYNGVSENGAKDWSFDKAIEVGKETVWVKDKESGSRVLHYAGDHDVTQEEMYLSKIYYDRALFLAMTEAALTPEGDGVTVQSTIPEIIAAIRPKDNSLQFGMGERTSEKWPTIENEAMRDHKKHAAGYALYYLVEDDIQKQLDQGTPKDEVMAQYGDGDPKQADARLREYSSAMRTGTLPHKHKWTGAQSYGLKQRRGADMEQAYDVAVSIKQANNRSDQLDLDFQQGLDA